MTAKSRGWTKILTILGLGVLLNTVACAPTQTNHAPDPPPSFTEQPFEKDPSSSVNSGHESNGFGSSLEEARKRYLRDNPQDAPPIAETWPENGLGWNEARNYVGSYQRVCGPVASIRGTEWGTFIDVGKDYPSTERFVFVVWDEWFYDPPQGNDTVCSTGSITTYEGIVQIELPTLGVVEFWN